MIETEYFVTFDRRTGEPIGVISSPVVREHATDGSVGDVPVRRMSGRIAVITVSTTVGVIAVAVVMLVLIGSRIPAQPQVIVCPASDTTSAATPSAACAPQGVAR